MLGKKNKRNTSLRESSAGKVPQRYTDYYRTDTKKSAVLNTTDGTNTTIHRRSKVKIHAGRIPSYVAVLAILISLIYSSIISNSVLVLVPEGKGLRERAYYEEVATAIMKKSIANKTKFTFDTRKFKQDFMQQVPEIKDVSLSVPIAGRKPVAGVTFVRPLYIFTVSGRSYVVGENGVILADASQIDSYKKADLRHINDNAPLNVAVGKAVLLASDIAFMEQMYGELLSAGVEVGDAILPLGAGELHIRPKNETYIIKFSLTGEARQQVGAYLAVRDSGALATKPQEYVDVRLAERVFVK